MEMKRAANQVGARFLVVTGIPELLDYSRKNGFHVLNPREALKNPLFALPKPYLHINEAGNGVLAWEIKKSIEKFELLDCG